MNNKKIIFSPTNELTNMQEMPSPASSNTPEWFKKAAPHLLNGEGYHDIIKVNKKMLLEDQEWNSTFKHCLPFVDALTCGYMITTPADILVINNKGIPYLKWNTTDTLVDNQHIDVLANTFTIPNEYYNVVFRWTTEWEIKTDNGYSILATHPFNRFDLPFYTLSGIIDSDKHPNSIFVPFFLKKDFEGIIPAGTPIVQIFPFKRESWESKKGKIDKQSKFASDRVKKYITNTYRKLYWTKKVYK